MVALWIIVIILIQSVVLVFALSLCKSAALADRQFEKARQAEQQKWATSSNAAEGGATVPISVKSRPAKHVSASAHTRGR
jgi:hypothetical protein